MTHLLVPLAFGVAASLATLLGGWLALRYAERITPVLAVSAGIVLGVAFFDLLPEALEMAADSYTPRTILTCTALGLLAYLLLGRSVASARGIARWHMHLGPASLTFHSFLDGATMGLAFQIAPEVGWMVALAVLTHDLADGVNTVSLALASSHRGMARRWLVVNGAAPLVGVLVGLSIQLPAWVLAPLLGVFAGVFLFIGACELVPRSFVRDGRLRTAGAVIGGVLLMLALSALAE